jgi:hypothetical protein
MQYFNFLAGVRLNTVIFARSIIETSRPMVLEHGKYRFGNGVDPLELCAKYGTPLYVYDNMHASPTRFPIRSCTSTMRARRSPT